jgi:hypothetical protein
LVAGTKEHLTYHQKRHFAERKASGKINGPSKTKNKKKQSKRKETKKQQLGIKRKRKPVTKEKQMENVERAKLKWHQKKEVQKLLRMEKQNVERQNCYYEWR